MATPRAQLIDSRVSLCYHLVSRCVRRSWLSGIDPLTGCQYDHRQAWLEERLLRLSATLRHAEIVERWSDSCAAINPSTLDVVDRRALIREQLPGNPHQVEQLRDTLDSLSIFMKHLKHLKQPIAWRANREDNCTVSLKRASTLVLFLMKPLR